MALKFNFKEAVKKPWVKWTLILCGMIAVFLILRAFMGGSSNSSGAADPNAAAELQAETALSAQTAQQNMQSASINAQAASQTSAQSAQLALQQETDATALASQKEGDASSLSLAGVQLSGLLDQLSAQTTQQNNALNTQVSLANITAGEQEQLAAGQNKLVTDINTSNNQTQALLAQIMAGVENTQSNNAAGVAIAQSNNQTSVANNETNAAVQIAAGNNDVSKTVSSNQTSASKTGSWLTTAALVASFL